MEVLDIQAKWAPQMLAILNEAIVNSTALYDYKERTLEQMASWFEVKEKGRYPVLGAFDDTGDLLGFASYGVFRTWPAYKYSVEHSLYVQVEKRTKGVGRLLLTELVSRARDQNYHVMIGAIDAANVASIGLHQRLGFHHAGTIAQAGFKFGRWLDLAFYQRILDTPLTPMDG